MRKVSLVLLGAALGIGASALSTQTQLLSGTSAIAASAETYRQLSLFGDVFEKVRTDYVEKPEESKLIDPKRGDCLQARTAAAGGRAAVVAQGIVTRELRVRLGMLAVGCGWGGVTAMDDLFSEAERRHGIHGGEIETSLMLALHPDLVRMERADDFVPLTVALERAGGLLTAEGRVGFGWMAQDRSAR